jgi:hypothetical protein
VSAPSDGYGEACIAAGGNRLFREPGILWPGLPGLAVWDGNPEAFDLDPYGLGGEGFEIAAGTAFRAEGVLTFDFGAYQLWPVTFETIDEPELPRPVPTRTTQQITVATQNLRRLGDPESDVLPATRLSKLSRHIREVLGSPHVLAVQEVMDLETLESLAGRIDGDDSAILYEAHLLEGNDYGGIDVGFLVRDPVEVRSVGQVGADERFTWDGSLLFDRPPLVLDAAMAFDDRDVEVTLVAVHLKSLGGIDDPVDGERVRQKRFEQSVWLSEWIQDRQIADPTGALIVLVDWTHGLPEAERYSFLYGCSAEDLDHILTNRIATPWVTGVAFGRGNVDAPHDFELDPTTALRSSDHDGLVIFVNPSRRQGHRRDVIRRSRPISP